MNKSIQDHNSNKSIDNPDITHMYYQDKYQNKRYNTFFKGDM